MEQRENSRPAIEPYADPSGGPQPRRRLLRTWLRRLRPIRRFVPRIPFEPARDRPDPEIAAHWGEHILIEDLLTVLHRDGTISGLRHIVTQLHSAEALTQWDELTRFWDERRELSRILQARLFLPDGTTRNALQRQQVVAAPDNHPNRHGRTLQVWFTPLRPGVILEFEEQFDQFRPDELGPFMWNHYFLKSRMPAVRRRFTVAVAEPFQLAYRVHNGDQTPAERSDKAYKVYTWDLHNVDGFEVDDWMPPIRDFVPWLDVSTAPSWAPFARKLYKELEPERAPRDVRELAIGLAANKSSDMDKSIAAYQYAAKDVRYGRPPAELFTRNIRASTQMIEDLRGDCKDKSALLVQLLRSMQLRANVAVVLTSDQGRAPFLPSARFNHALVKLTLDDQAIWLDAASGPFAFGDLPPTDQDIEAIVFHRDGFRFDRLPARDGTIPTESREINGRLATDGSYAFHTKVHFRGDLAARLRMLLTDHTEEHRNEVLQFWLGGDYPGSIGSEFQHDDVNDLTHGFGYSCQGRLERVARPLKNLLLLHVPWANTLAMTGPMSAVVRRQPLAVPLAHHNVERHTIALPESMSIVAAPEPVSHECEWSSYKCTMTATGSRLVCEREFRLRGPMVPGARFAEFREYWRQCSWADDAEVVLSVG